MKRTMKVLLVVPDNCKMPNFGWKVQKAFLENNCEINIILLKLKTQSLFSMHNKSV